MAMLRLFLIAGTAALVSACGCGGTDTCGEFGEPSHQAVVHGVVLDLNETPLAGIHTRVKYSGELRSGVGTQSDASGRFTATARTDLPISAPDTATAWVVVVQANPPPAAIVKDSVQVLLRFRPRTEAPVIVQTTIHLAVGP
jgi:hypothetical protein